MCLHANFLLLLSQIQFSMAHFLYPGLGNPLAMEFLHDGNNGEVQF